MKMDTVARISEAKKFLSENPDEVIATVARFFQFSDSTLRRSIARKAETAMQFIKSRQMRGQNKILKEHQIAALHKFIRSLLTCSIPSTKSLVFNSIRSLKLKKNCTFQGPFKRWFQT